MYIRVNYDKKRSRFLNKKEAYNRNIKRNIKHEKPKIIRRQITRLLYVYKYVNFLEYSDFK